MKHANSSATSDTFPRLRVGLKDVNQPDFADALTQQLGKHRITIMLTTQWCGPARRGLAGAAIKR